MCYTNYSQKSHRRFTVNTITRYHLSDTNGLEVLSFVPTGPIDDPRTEENQVKWSTTLPVPAIGQHVTLNTEWEGGVITGYFVEYSWLGFYFRPDVKPAWWVKQNKARGRSSESCMGFGCDIVADPDVA